MVVLSGIIRSCLCPIAGGNWNNAALSGVRTRNLNNTRTNSNTNVGGRDCDFTSSQLNSLWSDRDMVSGFLAKYFKTSIVVGDKAEALKELCLKRRGNLYEEIISSENMFQAFKDVKSSKRNNKTVYEFELNFGREMGNLLLELQKGTYKPKPYNKFYVYEPKKRVIYAPAFRDTVVQHALYRVVYPIFERTFITQSHGCRRDHGCHSASDYLLKKMRACDGEEYFLQLDIKKYFYSFDRSVLRKLLERKIKDKRVVDLLMMFADFEGDRGVPIGNLLSQLYGLIYLNPLDHYVKRTLKVKNYVRYVDDFVLIGLSQSQANLYLEQIKLFLKNELGLELSKATRAKIKKGINFVGYRTWQSHRLVRKYAVHKFRRACVRGKVESVVSMIGHAKDTQTIPHYKQILKEFGMTEKLPKKLQRSMV